MKIIYLPIFLLSSVTLAFADSTASEYYLESQRRELHPHGLWELRFSSTKEVCEQLGDYVVQTKDSKNRVTQREFYDNFELKAYHYYFYDATNGHLVSEKLFGKHKGIFMLFRTWFYLYKNQQLVEERSYLPNNAKHGVWTEYDATGSLLKRAQYDNDTLIHFWMMHYDKSKLVRADRFDRIEGKYLLKVYHLYQFSDNNQLLKEEYYNHLNQIVWSWTYKRDANNNVLRNVIEYSGRPYLSWEGDYNSNNQPMAYRFYTSENLLYQIWNYKYNIYSRLTEFTTLNEKHQKHGWYYRYNDSGNPVYEALYNNDQLVKQAKLDGENLLYFNHLDEGISLNQYSSMQSIPIQAIPAESQLRKPTP